jgi:prepilin-type N-terminal cleavage/methylation domain-containing protein
MKYCYNSINSSKNGFTLIELAVVVGIIATLIIVSFTGLLNMKQNMDLNRVARQLEATLKNCQSKAMYTGSYYKMDFYTWLNRYRVYKESELVQDIQLENINLHYTNFTNHKVYFYKTGVPSMGGTVTLKTKNGKTLYVIMTPVTARTRISTTPPENW